MTWVPYTNNSHEDTMLFGDDQGNMNLITIAAKDLTMKNSKGDKNFSQNYVIEPKKLTYPISKRKVHDDWVLKVKYFPELRCFASCSPSSRNSFALEEVEKLLDHKSDIRTVGITKGVNAFDFCARANIIATGGVDKVIRVWHPHIFSRPTGKLIGHLFTIIDIVCNEKDQHIISLSTARVFRIWDIHTLTSLQVFTDNEERPGEKRIYSMVFDNKHDRLITGSSVVDAWPLTRAVQDTMQVPHTHDRPISQIFYNKELNQVITVCTESTIKVWESETGKMMYQMTEAHGPNIEVTALTMDSSGYRLATAGNDASVKVWDFGSGQEIKHRTGRGSDDQDFSIIAMQYCTVDNEKCIICMGWNNRLRLLQDSHTGYDLPVLRDFVDIYYLTQEVTLSPAEDPFNTQPLPDIGQRQSISNVTNVFKKEYVLTTHELTCLTSLLPDVLATGCTNGNIILWNITKSTVDKIFYMPEPERSSSQGNRVRLKSGAERGVTVVKILEHRVRRLDPAFIKRLTKHLASDDEDEEGESNGRYRSRRTSRATSFSRRSRTTSRTSAAGTVVTIDRNLLDELTAKIEGDDYDKEDGNKQAVKKEIVMPGNVDEQKPDDTKQDAEKEKDKTEGEDKEATESVQASTEGSKDGDKKESQSEQKQQNNETQESLDDPDANMIVDTYDPVLVSCHQDSFIRFWSMQGNLLREITAMTRRQGSAVTSMCTDKDCHIMITGDSKGYLTLWDVGNFLKTPESEEQDLIQQVTCWRAHLTKVVQLVYIDAQKAILSGSTDGSVRVWWGTKGRFVGFYGQHRPFLIPNSEETASTPVLPYDINEGPLAPVRAKNNDQQKIRAVQKFEYPLMFTNDKWRPFRRSAYWEERTRKQEPEDKKFFAALIKPRAYKAHLESFTTGEMRQGAVFRALPVYRVKTPKKLKTPEFSFPMPEEDENALMFADFNQQPKEVRFRSPKNERSLKGNAFATEQANRTFGRNARDGDKKPAMKKISRLAPTNTTGIPSTSNSPSLYPQSPRKR